MSVASEITRIQNEVSSQANTIDEIILFLDSEENYKDKYYELIYKSTKIINDPYLMEIGDHVYEGSVFLTSLTAPNITRVGNYAFNQNYALSEVNIGNVEDIGKYAFADSAIVHLYIPKAIRIDDYAFDTVKALQEVDASSVANIGQYAFNNNTNLINFKGSPRTIGQYGFNATKQLKEMDLSKCTSLGQHAFSYSGLLEANASSLTSGTLGFFSSSQVCSAQLPALTSLPQSGFMSCYNLFDLGTINAISTSSTPIRYCRGLKNLYLPKTTSVSSSTYVFADCNILKTAMFGDISSLPNYAFSNCYNLQNLYLPRTSSITTISSTNVFTNCIRLANIYVPESLLSTYQSASYWSNYSGQFKALTETVGEVQNKRINTTKENAFTSVAIPLLGYSTPPSVTIAPESSYVQYKNLKIDARSITFDIYSSNMNISEYSQVAVMIEGAETTQLVDFDIFLYNETEDESSYTIRNIGTYGFELEEDGITWVSNNGGIDSSYALCEVSITNPGGKYVVINAASYGESGFDYGVFSEPNIMLSESITDTDYYYSMKKISSSTFYKIPYGILPSGTALYIKYRKDGSNSSNSDNLRFRVEFY